MKRECDYKHRRILVDRVVYRQGVVDVGVELEDSEVTRVILTWPDPNGDWIGHPLPGKMDSLKDLYAAIGNMLDRVERLQGKVL